MYPRSAMFGKTKAVPNVYYSDYFSYNPHVYEQNMSVVVDPGICSEATLSGRLSLGAYVGNELRGVTRVTPMNNRGLYFITVSANQANEEVQFKLLDELTGNTISMQGQVTFTSNQHLGSLAKPIEIKPIGSFACESFASVVNKDLNLSVFPNPFGKQVALFIQNISSPELTISVYDITGKQVDEFTHLTQNSQNTQVSWEPELRGISVKPGFYFVEVNSGGQLIRAKIIKK